MNETDLVNADLHDEADGIGESAAVVAAAPVAPAADEVQTPAAAVVTDAVTKARSGAGRKVDTTGTTALGTARILYAANPGLGTKELRALFVEKLGPKFGTTESVAQTYVSLVRKPKAKKAA
ncbi:predicted ORF [Xanthomonas phage XacN1]|nr:predicted ORF [Xanthomonas phage XacN1]BBA65676.1 predicted ORF [Xanthomonas phage XacN1]